MAYSYINSEPGLWTVGERLDGGKWDAESDHDSLEKAAARVHYLNGGNPAYDVLVKLVDEKAALLAQPSPLFKPQSDTPEGRQFERQAFAKGFHHAAICHHKKD